MGTVTQEGGAWLKKFAWSWVLGGGRWNVSAKDPGLWAGYTPVLCPHLTSTSGDENTLPPW